jgi:hypothetical protein
MADQLEEQRCLLNLVSDLEVPAMTLAEGLLFAPIVGNLDSTRVQRITAGLLDAVHTRRARRVVLDISGVPTMDTAFHRRWSVRFARYGCWAARL